MYSKKVIIAAVMLIVTASSFAAVDATVTVLGWDGTYDTSVYPAGQSGVVGISNDLGGSGDRFEYWSDDPAIGGRSSAFAGISGVSGSSAGDPAGYGSASASLNIDLTGQPVQSASGISAGAFGGLTDSYGSFSVTFNINATVTGDESNGFFGVYVDVFDAGPEYSANADDMPIISAPTITGYYGDMSEFLVPRLKPVYQEYGEDHAWTFGYDSYSIKEFFGGTVNDTLTATFAFAKPAGINDVKVEITAFAMGEQVPEPATMALLGLGGLLLRRRKNA